MLTQKLSHGVEWRGNEFKEDFDAFLQQIFPTSIEEKTDEVKTLTEIYHKYKREYVKHLSFNADNENLSKSILYLSGSFVSSCYN